MFKDNLITIKKDLKQHNRSRTKLLEYYISTRLNKNIAAYYEDILDSYDYLDNRNELNLLKKMSSKRNSRK